MSGIKRYLSDNAYKAAEHSESPGESNPFVTLSKAIAMRCDWNENATFKGVATPTTTPGTQDGHVFYIASAQGTYTNFGGFVLDGGFAVLSNVTGSWVGTKFLKTEMDAKADHGYGGEETVKTVKDVDDELVQVRSDLNERVQKEDDGSSTIPDESDAFYVLDFYGNIVAEFSRLGLNIKRINLGNTATLFDDSSEEIVITDRDGHIVAEIGKNGIESVNTIITNDFANKIAMPKYLYMFSNKINNIYKQPVIKRNIGNYKLRYSATKIGRQYANMTSIVNPTDLDVLNCTLYKIDEEEFRVVDTKETILRCKPQGVGTTPVYAQVMGDSWVHSGFFHYAMKQKGYVPQLNLIGTRNFGYSSTVYTDAYGEGRGGWNMSSYFSIQNSDTACPSPYYHPVGNYRYWGATGYWKSVYDYSISHDQSVFYNYYNQSCSTVCQGIYFNSDGTLKAPNSGDILYDSLNAYGLGVGYVLYNGTTWVTTSTSAYTWAFDYAKYLTMFSEMLGANPPTYLFVSLGINDFSQLANIAAVTTAFASYKSNADKLIASYLSAVPSGKVIFCLPLSSWGWEDNQAGGNTMDNFTHFCNAKMWEARRLMIEEYDNRDAESIYLVDVGIMIDEDFGYSTTTEIPFSEYEGTETIKVQGLQTPHPSPSYPNAGMPLAAFIQYFRD